MCCPNIKFLCLTQCQRELCTDTDADDTDVDTNNDDYGQFMTV